MSDLILPEDIVLPSGQTSRLYSLPALERRGLGRVSRLPVCLRLILESLLRSCDGIKVTEDHIRQLAGWQPGAARDREIPFCVARVLLQDFTGVPLLCDLAAMRGAARRMGQSARLIEPRLPVDLVIDHSVQIDVQGGPDALAGNMALEFARNHERYRFIKWGMQAFAGLRVVPPGIGIVHQVNMEFLTRPLWQRDGICFPDSLVGTDSHTTMINGLGVVGWGVGGIEAEAAMLGQPIHLLTPDVVGVHLHGKLPPGVNATDLVLQVTERLRAAGVVGKLVEFCGPGAASLSVPERATLANMAPEYGATMGFFATDETTLTYLLRTARDPQAVAALRAYLTAQGLFGMPAPAQIDYSALIDFDLSRVGATVAGPRRPQDRIPLAEVGKRFSGLFSRPATEHGYGKPPDELGRRYPLSGSRQPHPAQDPTSGVSGTPTTESGKAGTALRHEIEMVEAAHTPGPTAPAANAITGAAPEDLGHGDVVIAAITSCTNTSNPRVMCAAGLLAAKAVAKGLRVSPRVKTSLAPGSRVVTAYLERLGLLAPLERLGFAVAAYGCTTCIGNSGPLPPAIEETIARHDLVCAAVLSGNRNFEARIHPSVRGNFLMSPPLVVAFAIAGRIGIDLDHEPLATGSDGAPVYLRDLWPRDDEIDAVLPVAGDPTLYRERYERIAEDGGLWGEIRPPLGDLYHFESSTYIAEPPFFQDFTLLPAAIAPIRGARALAVFGDSITTDHISPAGAILPESPAGRYLQDHGVAPVDFNSYGARRGNHEVMVRGTFANPRIRNLMLPLRDDGTRQVGGFTVLHPGGERLTIFDAAMRYRADRIPTLIFAGSEYGSGSSRDWAAKGTLLLGVRAVVARSFERIHRSNLVGMGVLPLEFRDGERIESLDIRGDERFDLMGLEEGPRPRGEADLVVHRAQGGSSVIRVRVRIDTDIEAEYVRHGGVLPYSLRTLLARTQNTAQA